MQLGKIKRYFCDNRGSVLMEFLLVAPLYFALLGGLFTVGELLLLGNRMAVADRNMSYIIPHLNEQDPSVYGDILKVVINLTGKNVADYKDADLGYTRKSPEFTFKQVNNTAEVTAETDWGKMYATALTVNNVEFPAFINGMKIAISIFAGDRVKNEDFVYSLGELMANQLGRHYLIARENDVSGRHVDSTECLKTALNLSIENVLGYPAINTDDSQADVDIVQDNYERMFGSLFSQK